ncbi:MAG: hypothetical protein ABIK09_05515 [Pseudomonadota bacterium]
MYSFEEHWHNWGRATVLVLVAAALAALWFLGDLEEPVFALVALGTTLSALLSLMVVSCLVNLTSLGLRVLSVLFAGAVVAGGLALVVDPVLPAAPLVERPLAHVGARLTWVAGGRAGQAVLVRVKGSPGMRQDGKDKRLEIQIEALRGPVFDVLSLALYREGPPTLSAAGGGGGGGGKGASRTDAVRETVLPSAGDVTLVLTEVTPEAFAPLTVSVHPVRVPPSTRAVIAWGLLAISLLLGALAARDGVPSFFPVAGAAGVVFLYISAGNLGPSAVLAPLGGALLVSAAVGGVAGLLINALLDRLLGPPPTGLD